MLCSSRESIFPAIFREIMHLINFFMGMPFAREANNNPLWSQIFQLVFKWTSRKGDKKSINTRDITNAGKSENIKNIRSEVRKHRKWSPKCNSGKYRNLNMTLTYKKTSKNVKRYGG